MARRLASSGTGWRTVLALCAFASAMGSSHAEAEAAEEPAAGGPASLLEILQTAPAPPVPPFFPFPEAETRSPAHRSLVGFDLATGEVDRRTASPWPTAATAGRVLPREPAWLWDADLGRFVAPHRLPRTGGDGDSLAGICSPPASHLLTHDFPWNTVAKLVMRFSSGGQDYFYGCSGAMLGPFHLLTAGHCIYLHDPDFDGDTSDSAFAEEIWAWPAQTDLVNPFQGHPQGADWPYGFAKATYLRTYDGWIASINFNHDMAYLTLDRRIGDRTGWMGREADVTASGLSFDGYPVETPYVPEGTLTQFPRFDPENVYVYTPFRINLCAYVYGGHSGGPNWRTDGTDHFIQGVNSTSNRAGGASATRLTAEKLADVAAFMAEDETVRPPEARPELTEYVFTTGDDLKDLLANSVPRCGSLEVEHGVLNAGFAPSGEITVDFYLSTDHEITPADVFIGSHPLPSLGGGSFTNPVTTLEADAPPGTYYLGWILRGTEAEYEGDVDCGGEPCTNVSVIADETLTVTEGTCLSGIFSDGFESGNASAWTRVVPGA